MQDRQRHEAHTALGRMVRHPATAAIVALGITQIVAWGTTLYALGVLGKPIAADTGWSQSLVFGGLTVGLLVSGAVSAAVGRFLDRRGGRATMALGSILVSIGLVLLALVTSPWAYLAVWAFLGLAMRLSLYDAAFAALVQVTPSRGRRAISYLTLFGGFASSVFWPIGHALDAAYGWRNTLLIFAAVNLVICLPLHWLGLARRETAEQAEEARSSEAAAAPTGPPLEGATRTVAMVLFSVIVAASAVVFGALAVHLVPILEATGLAAAHRRARRLPQGRGAGRRPHLGPHAGAPVASDRCRPRLGGLHPAVVRGADAGRGRFLDGAGVHPALRRVERPRHHHARCGAARAVRSQRATARCSASSQRPTSCWRRSRLRPSPSWSSAGATPRQRRSCWAPGSSPSSAWR